MLTLADIEGRLVVLGFTRGADLGSVAAIWDSPPDAEGTSGRWLLSCDVHVALKQLQMMEATVLGSELLLGRRQILDRVRALRDSRARYVRPDGKRDDPVALQVSTLDSLLAVLEGDGYSMNGFAHSFDWEKYAMLVALQNDPLLTGVGTDLV